MWEGLTAHDGCPADFSCAPAQPCHEAILDLLDAALLLQQVRQVERYARQNNDT